MISDIEHAENAFSKGHNSFKIKDTAITLTFLERYYLFLSFDTKRNHVSHNFSLISPPPGILGVVKIFQGYILVPSHFFEDENYGG